jgi:PKD repeat protein
MPKRVSVFFCIFLLLLFVISSFGIHSVIGARSNKRPVADAGGAYFGTEGVAISFDGSGSYDSNGIIVSWLWDFGDGESSTEQNPTHVYAQDGTYSVSLLVTDDDDATGEDMTYVEVADVDPVADFVASPVSGIEPLSVTFRDLSTSYDGISSWLWDFGDGESSTEQNPTHVYAQDGTYSVSLLVTDDDDETDEDMTYVEVADVDPVADFVASPVSGIEPLSVTFRDLSTSHDGVSSWLWDFGDGQISLEQNPTHVYAQGVYSVSLTVEEEDGDVNIETKQDIINVELRPNSYPVADFVIQSSVQFAINETISFTDHSSDNDGTIVSWFWNFGDSTTSAMQNPTHEYRYTGIYTVTLTVRDDDGATDSAARQITIHEITPPTTIHDYDGLWHNIDFSINLSATDDYSGVAETYYKINNDSVKNVSFDGQPRITINGANNSLEYWSLDNLGNEEAHHTLLGIKLDKTSPIADAGQDITVNEDTILMLDGKHSSDNIQITSYTWVLLDGTLKKLSGVTSQYIFNAPGEYTVTLIVVDAAQNSANSTVTITVVDVTDPVANAGDDKVIVEGTTATFDGLNSTDNVEIKSYIWSFVDGAPRTLVGVDPTYIFSSAGVYEVTLTVSDEQGNFAVDAVLVTVIDATWPAANAGADQIVLKDTLVCFDGSASSDNVGIVSYVWSFADGEIQFLYGVDSKYCFGTSGVYVVTLTVSDAEGHSSNDTVSVIVRDNAAPTIDVENFAPIVEDIPVSFVVSTSNENVGIVNYSWVFGDGTVENTSVPSVVHIFDESGNYTVELTVIDITGNVDSAVISVVVYRDTDGDLLADYLDEDDDADGMPDTWELFHELNTTDASDAILDRDGDGVSNLEEYQRNTSPEVYTFGGYSLADILTASLVLSIICFVLFYAGFFAWVSRQFNLRK